MRKEKYRQAAACFLTAALVLSGGPVQSVLAETESVPETVRQEQEPLKEESTVPVMPGTEVPKETEPQMVPLTEQTMETGPETQMEQNAGIETKTQTRQNTETETKTEKETESETTGETSGESEPETEDNIELETEEELKVPAEMEVPEASIGSGKVETETENSVIPSVQTKPTSPNQENQMVKAPGNVENIVKKAAVTGDGYLWDSANGILTLTNNSGLENAWDDGTGRFNWMNLRVLKIGSGVTELPSSLYIVIASMSVQYSLDFRDAVNLKTIGEQVFEVPYINSPIDLSNCTSLTSIGDNAFATTARGVDITGCVNLTNIGTGFTVTSSSVWLTTLTVNGNQMNSFDRTGNTVVDFGDVASEVFTLNAGVLSMFNGAQITVSRGNANVVSGRAGADLTVPLKPGLNELELTVSWDGYSRTYPVQVHCTLAENPIRNKDYKDSYVYGDDIPNPTKENFNCVNPNADFSFAWYAGDQTEDGADLGTALSGKPSDPGTYTLVVTAPADQQYGPAELRLRIVIDSASYHVTIPSNATAGGDEVSLTPSDFKIGQNGQVRVTVSGGAEEGKVTLTRQETGTENAVQITSKLLNGKNGAGLSNGSTAAVYGLDGNGNVALQQGTTGELYFAAPTETNIAAGTYSGTVQFQISYEIAENNQKEDAE